MSSSPPLQAAPSLPGLPEVRDALNAGSDDALVRLFRWAGAEPPTVIWRPGATALAHPLLERALQSLDRAADAKGRVPEKWLDGDSARALEPSLLVLEPGRPDAEFRYVRCGADVADGYGRDITGMTTADFPDYIAVFLTALYQMALQRGEVVLSVHQPPRNHFIRYWRRLIVPLHDAAGRVTLLANISVADNDLRAGLDAVPGPVLLLTASGDVCFANRDAMTMFGCPRFLPQGQPLEAVTGLSVDLSTAPDEMVRRGPVEVARRMLVQKSLLVPVRVSVGATFYRGLLYYIVSLRQLQEG